MDLATAIHIYTPYISIEMLRTKQKPGVIILKPIGVSIENISGLNHTVSKMKVLVVLEVTQCIYGPLTATPTTSTVTISLPLLIKANHTKTVAQPIVIFPVT